MNSVLLEFQKKINADIINETKKKEIPIISPLGLEIITKLTT